MMQQLSPEHRLLLVHERQDVRVRHVADLRLLPVVARRPLRQAVGNGLVRLGERVAESPLEPAGPR